MIVYFSATGNSRYTAKKIAEIIGDEALDLFGNLRNKNFTALYSEKPWVLVCPTYAWQIPHIVRDWLAKTPLNGNKKLYTVMTCGDSVGTAGEYIRKICSDKGLEYCGCAKIAMPDNYLVMFESPDKAKAAKKIAAAEQDIISAAQQIKNGKSFAETKYTAADKINSSAVNILFYQLCVKAKPFHATDKCVSCGLCEKVCPLGNITLQNGRPVWGKDCTHCMACICSCPKEAIEYGKKTQGKIRYRFPEDI